MRFLTVSLDKHAIWLKEEQTKISKSLIIMATLQQSAWKKDGDIRYLTPLNIETTNKRNIVVSKNQESNILIIKMLIEICK
jgi:hypothetical protein